MDSGKLGKFELELEREIYRESFYEFYKVAFCQLHPGQEYDENWHAKYICDRLQEETERIIRKEPRKKDLIINVPFRSSKSMIVTVIWPIWAWTRDASLKFISTSYSGDLALEHSRRSRDLFGSFWFQRLYGHRIKVKGNVDASSHWETTDTGMRKAVGMGGQITGSGSDIIIVDDPINPKKAASEVERQNAIDFYNHTLFSRLNQPDIGVRIIVMQRLHEEDLTGHLLDPKKGRPAEHEHICIPAEYDENTVQPPELKSFYKDNLFWLTRFGRLTLAAYHKALGSLQYAGQLNQRPVPPEGNLFKRAWFQIIKAEHIQRDREKHPIEFFVDTAYTEKQENDPTGLLACFKKDGDIYIVNFSEVWMEFPELIKFVPQYVRLNDYTNYSVINIEPKASGKSTVQQLKSQTQLNVIEIESEILKDDKVTRATAISPIAQAGRIKIVEGPWNEKFISQLCSFPKASHDEAVDTLVYAVDRMLPVNEDIFGFI
jgi:predicted phage terminase large subunit-like protein